MFITADFQKVVCPRCEAKAGSSCRSAGGRKICALYPHIDRVRAFVAYKRLVEEQIPMRAKLNEIALSKPRAVGTSAA